MMDNEELQPEWSRSELLDEIEDLNLNVKCLLEANAALKTERAALVARVGELEAENRKLLQDVIDAGDTANKIVRQVAQQAIRYKAALESILADQPQFAHERAKQALEVPR